MHLPDGFVDPKIAAGLGVFAATVLAYAVEKVHQAVTKLEQVPVLAALGNGVVNISGKVRRVLSQYGRNYMSKLGLVTSMIFAAQMFNFPISSGTSGHLIGGFYAAVILGPWGGSIAITLVLLIQAVFYADGGLAVLGANIVNMAIVASIGGYFLYRYLNKWVPENFTIMFVAWLSVVAASFACALEMGLSETFNIGEVLLQMSKVHMIIGIGEAVITVLLITITKKLLHEEE
ncbi:cobalamin biosynthesis protein CbiM [Propionigenium maris DSM 9537]|uniref:Cobalamin biosynthesis protein CbiM n=1 Tax=Propionigenium maris DSM 9537 TaxID=1123000 RepID=A0A9W6LLJ3_9FUSO|nr:energy-coupling factor ABC transporter permease [Propionigenium maris]GLI55366.1 cobalamin biosynthesis protein CbiM [Propionigenium maris DSM 9537]